MAGYSCIVELTDEEGQAHEVVTLLSPHITPEIIYPIHGFVDGIVMLTETSSNHFSAISFFRSKAVSFWVSRNDGAQFYQN